VAGKLTKKKSPTDSHVSVIREPNTLYEGYGSGFSVSSFLLDGCSRLSFWICS
jgi:hypothetical protein